MRKSNLRVWASTAQQHLRILPSLLTYTLQNTHSNYLNLITWFCIIILTYHIKHFVRISLEIYVSHKILIRLQIRLKKIFIFFIEFYNMILCKKKWIVTIGENIFWPKKENLYFLEILKIKLKRNVKACVFLPWPNYF
jgi:hypothetical protein